MKTLKLFLITIICTTLLFVGYLYFSQAMKSEADASSLSSSLSTTNATTASNSSLDQITQDTAFLATLGSLTRINIDTSIFSDPGFKALKANEIVIDPVAPGRDNPFDPITATPVPTTTTSAPPVVTGDASAITSTTAVLNGTLANPTASVNNYFEYGVDSTLTSKSVTSSGITTLVGTFNAKITKLTSHTTYYFRAASKINGAVVYGDIMSFTTN